MTTLKAIALTGAVLAIGLGLVFERRARARLEVKLAAVELEVQQLAKQVASQKESEIETRAAAPSLENPPAELRRLHAEIDQLRARMVQLESAGAAVSNQLASASGANTPFVYADSIRRKDYVFSGYAVPQSALHSMFWALTQSDPGAYQQSVTDETAEAFANASKDLPEGIMPGGYKNGALYRATGFRVMEETPVSDEETRLKIFLEGRQNLVLKLVFRKIGEEWKLSRTEF